MSLATDAANDWQEIMNDDLGASWPCVITSPAGVEKPFLCRMSDTAQQTNPSTNEVVSGRSIAVSISTTDLAAVGFQNVRGIEDDKKKPWLMAIEDAEEVSGDYKVVETNPDRSMSNTVIWLEAVK